MKDFNFFAGYSKKRERGQMRTILFASAAALLLFVGFCAFTVYYTFELRLRAIGFEIEANRLFTESQDTEDKLKLHDELSSRLEQIGQYNKKVEKLTDSLLRNSIIKTSLITGISNVIPSDTSIDSMSVSDGIMDISGTSEKEISIAEFEHNLKGLAIVEDVFVSDIAGVAGSYEFSMSVAIKEAADVRN